MALVTTVTPIGPAQIEIDSHSDGTLTWMVPDFRGTGDWTETISAGEALALATALMVCVHGIDKNVLDRVLLSPEQKRTGKHSERQRALIDALHTVRRAAKEEVRGAPPKKPSVWKVVAALEKLVVESMDDGKEESSATT